MLGKSAEEGIQCVECPAIAERVVCYVHVLTSNTVVHLLAVQMSVA